MDLRKLPAGQRLKDGTQLAKQLQQILDRDAQFDLAALSGNPEGDPPGTNRERVDSFSVDGRPLALELERVTVGSGAKIWVFSSASVDLIPRIARLASDSPIEKYLPEPLVSWKLIDTSLWRWIALLLLAAALAALSMLASRLEVLLGPLRLLLAVLGFRAGLEWIDPSPALRLYLERGAGLLFFLALAWLGMRITDLLIVRLRGALGGKHRTFSYSVLPLASRVVKIVIVAVTAAALLSSWGYNTGAILAGLGVGGIALALAAQKTIENLFGGVAVITDRPVTIGDFCRVGDKVGTVEDIGLRSTRILNLRRDTTSGQVRTLLESITKALQQNPKVETGPIPVRFVGVGTYSLDVEIFAYVLTRDGDEFTRIQQELFLWILDAVEAAGTALAVPTQAYYSMARTPHQNGAPVPQETRA